jgi:hypothetical protein
VDLVLTLDRVSAVARLDKAMAPKTCAALVSVLPFSATVHLAKIAGHEFYVHVPLFLEVEHRQRVAELAEGTVAFWPERQLLCVYYGCIQQEDASVTALGMVIENRSGLAQAAESLRSKLGRVIATVHVSRREAATAPPPPTPDASAQRSGLARAVYDAYGSIRQTVPADVRTLMNRRGPMQPAGPLLCGEGETRKLHEFAWLVRAEIMATGMIPGFVSAVLEHYAGRLAGWYALPQAGALVQEVAAALPRMRGDQAREVVEGLILYIGRLSLWLDACIPWDGINALLQQAPLALDGPPAGDAEGERRSRA